MTEVLDAPKVEQESEQLSQYVDFMLADEAFAVRMQSVEEIIRLPATFTVPLTPGYLMGLANLRGQILPVLCLRTLLAMDRTEMTDATRVIVITAGALQIGFTVDRVINVATPEPSAIKETNTAGGKIDPELIANVIHEADTIIQVLNTSKLLDNSVQAKMELTAQRFNHTNNFNELGDAEDEAMRQLVCCLVDGQEYAFPLEETQEIVRIPSNITQVPLTDSSVVGVINLRGKTLPLVSLRAMFGLPTISFCDNHRVLVVNIEHQQQKLPIGIVIDGVREVIRLRHDQLDPLPQVMTKLGRSQEIAAICNLDNGQRTLSVVAVDKLFDGDTLDSMSEVYQPEEAEMHHQDDELLDDDSTDTQLVIFKLDKEEFGISIHAVQEIIRIPAEISRVPKTDSFIEGVINLRGNVLPIVDLRNRFNLPEMARHDRQRILVVNFERISTGFIVDSVSEVLRIPESSLENAPVLSEEQAQLMKQVVNVDKRLVGVLSADQLLSNTEMYKLHMAANDVVTE